MSNLQGITENLCETQDFAIPGYRLLLKPSMDSTYFKRTRSGNLFNIRQTQVNSRSLPTKNLAFRFRPPKLKSDETKGNFEIDNKRKLCWMNQSVKSALTFFPSSEKSTKVSILSFPVMANPGPSFYKNEWLSQKAQHSHQILLKTMTVESRNEGLKNENKTAGKEKIPDLNDNPKTNQKGLSEKAKKLILSKKKSVKVSDLVIIPSKKVLYRRHWIHGKTPGCVSEYSYDEISQPPQKWLKIKQKRKQFSGNLYEKRLEEPFNIYITVSKKS